MCNITNLYFQILTVKYYIPNISCSFAKTHKKYCYRVVYVEELLDVFFKSEMPF